MINVKKIDSRTKIPKDIWSNSEGYAIAFDIRTLLQRAYIFKHVYMIFYFNIIVNKLLLRATLFCNLPMINRRVV